MVEAETANATCSSGDEDEDQAVTAKPLKKGKEFLNSSFVEDIQDNAVDKVYHVKAHVHHSLKKEKP